MAFIKIKAGRKNAEGTKKSFAEKVQTKVEAKERVFNSINVPNTVVFRAGNSRILDKNFVEAHKNDYLRFEVDVVNQGSKIVSKAAYLTIVPKEVMDQELANRGKQDKVFIKRGEVAFEKDNSLGSVGLAHDNGKFSIGANLDKIMFVSDTQEESYGAGKGVKFTFASEAVEIPYELKKRGEKVVTKSQTGSDIIRYKTEKTTVMLKGYKLTMIGASTEAEEVEVEPVVNVESTDTTYSVEL